MTVERIDTLVVGAGQAGLAMSRHLTRRGVPHLVLERHRIAERWRSERWNSLVANGPAWHDRFPDMTFADVDPDGFATRQNLVDYFVAYAEAHRAPVRTGVEVRRVERDARGRFRVETSAGPMEANNLVAATGPFQRPLVPALVPAAVVPVQMHSSAYREPGRLPDGAVLVVGAGSSGTQIADELAGAGKRVFLSIGPHDRPPRRYRGRDFCWWLGELGLWNAETRDPTMEHVTIAVSGADGGRTIDFRQLAARGVTLLGRTEAFAEGALRFAPDLRTNIERGDAYYLALLDAADAHVRRKGLDLPEEPEARRIDPHPACVTEPLRTLDLAKENVTAIVWATGYAYDFGWLTLDVFDAKGRPVHTRGVSPVPGLFFLGLPWLTRRASAFIWGVWHDAAHLADRIADGREDAETSAAPLAASA